LSSQNAITVEWDSVDSTDGVVVTGYHMYMDDGYNGEFTEIFDGTNLPYTTQSTAVQLITGLPYRFKVQSQNINGFSVDSSITKIYACLKPSSLPAATKVGTTLTSITIRWSEPVPNGCPIQGFSILRDTGNNDDLSVTVDPDIVSNKPSLR
jgi:hypothetical protein